MLPPAWQRLTDKSITEPERSKVTKAHSSLPNEQTWKLGTDLDLETYNLNYPKITGNWMLEPISKPEKKCGMISVTLCLRKIVISKNVIQVYG